MPNFTAAKTASNTQSSSSSSSFSSSPTSSSSRTCNSLRLLNIFSNNKKRSLLAINHFRQQCDRLRSLTLTLNNHLLTRSPKPKPSRSSKQLNRRNKSTTIMINDEDYNEKNNNKNLDDYDDDCEQEFQQFFNRLNSTQWCNRHSTFIIVENNSNSSKVSCSFFLFWVLPPEIRFSVSDSEKKFVYFCFSGML